MIISLRYQQKQMQKTFTSPHDGFFSLSSDGFSPAVTFRRGYARREIATNEYQMANDTSLFWPPKEASQDTDGPRQHSALASTVR